jgi:DNA-binding transcriptional LysR family regulator
VIAAAEECERAGRGELGPTPVELTLGTRHELGLSWIQPLIPRIQRALPGLTIHMYVGSSADLLARVRAVDIDCAVGSMRLVDPTLDAVRLHPETYVMVASPRLLASTPFRTTDDASAHVLIDTHSELPLFAYWRDAPRGGDRLRFRRVQRMGTIAAIRASVLDRQGVAVLPEYLVADDLRTHRLVRVLPQVKPLSDYFRLIFRADDPRRTIYERIAAELRSEPLR